jgi:DNA-binding transcriptional regulator YiaG
MTPDHLRALISRSGLSVSRWARDVAGRDVRTVQRWCAGDIAIPDSAAAWLLRIESVRATARRTTIRIHA